MLIHIQADIAALANINIPLLTSRVSEMLRAHRLGIHLLVMNRATAQWLEEQLSLSPQDKATLIRLMQNITQTGDLVRRAKHLIQISSDSSHVTRLDSRVVDVGLNFRYFEQILLEPAFILEDIDDDADLFRLIFETIGDRFVSGERRFDARHGGGDSSLRVTRNQIARKTIVVTTIDSDKPAPCAPDTKLQRLARLSDEEKWPLFYFFQTPCRELENFIPLDVVIAAGNVYKWAHLSAFVENSDFEQSNSTFSAHEDFWLWFDIKDGITSSIISQIGDGASSEWIRYKLEKMSIPLEHINIAGLGPRLVRYCLSSDHILPHLRKSIKTKRWIAIFGGYIENFLWIFLAPPRSRT